MFSERRTPTYIRVWKGIHGIRDFAKKRCRIWDLTAHRKWDSSKLGMGCGIAIKKESGMRDFHKKGAGMRDQDPPFPDPATCRVHVCMCLNLLLGTAPRIFKY